MWWCVDKRYRNNVWSIIFDFIRTRAKITPFISPTVGRKIRKFVSIVTQVTTYRSQRIIFSNIKPVSGKMSRINGKKVQRIWANKMRFRNLWSTQIVLWDAVVHKMALFKIFNTHIGNIKKPKQGDDSSIVLHISRKIYFFT